MTIMTSGVVVGSLGLIIGVLLGACGKIFSVFIDERVVQVRSHLPGNNCGACGYTGCDALAKAIVAGSAPVNACPAGCSDEALKLIAQIMNSDIQEVEREVMYVKCHGSFDVAKEKYEYVGNIDCKQAMVTPGSGSKACSYGCLGLGSCVKVCAFDAIHIENGIAVIDPKKCIHCGRCQQECPKNLIESTLLEHRLQVYCNSMDGGKTVRNVCKVGCIGCGVCVKVCPMGAIARKDNLAYIDKKECIECGLCQAKCPTHAIMK